MFLRARHVTVLAIVLALTAAPATAQVTRADYARAERFLSHNARKLVFTMEAAPNWIENGDRFWYSAHARAGKTFVIVDPAAGSSAPAFDHQRLARGLNAATGARSTADRLPFDRFDFTRNATAIDVEVEDVGWRCDIVSYTCEKTASQPGTESALAGRSLDRVRPRLQSVRQAGRRRESATAHT